MCPPLTQTSGQCPHSFCHFQMVFPLSFSEFSAALQHRGHDHGLHQDGLAVGRDGLLGHHVTHVLDVPGRQEASRVTCALYSAHGDHLRAPRAAHTLRHIRHMHVPCLWILSGHPFFNHM